jgi:hypothetical protein
MIVGGPGAEPSGKTQVWLVTDEKSELIAKIRRLAKAKGLVPRIDTYCAEGLQIKPGSTSL